MLSTYSLDQLFDGGGERGASRSGRGRVGHCRLDFAVELEGFVEFVWFGGGVFRLKSCVVLLVYYLR